MDNRAKSASAAPQAQARKLLRPRDAATLVIVDTTSGVERVLMGRRRDDQVFMPGKYVFPGGRVDKEDRLVTPADDLHPGELNKLLFDMKGGPSRARARSIALAAVRETFEEAGIVIGTAVASATTATASWQSFFSHGFAPSLQSLTLIARAITPPGGVRRYDTRFFCIDASAIAHRTEINDGELSGLHWLSLDEARALELPSITRVVLEDLSERLRSGAEAMRLAPVPYYHHRNGRFRRDMVTGEAPPS